MNIGNIDWGDDSAEKDENLFEYFVSSSSFQRLSEKRKSIVVGRKGSGKSALMKMLHEFFNKETGSYVVRITPSFSTIRTVLNDRELKECFGEEIFFQHTWLRQILLDLLCEIGHKAKGSYCNGSETFARRVAITSYWKTKFFRRKYHLKRIEIEDMILEIFTSVALDSKWFNDLIDNTDVYGLMRILYEIGFVGDFVLGGSGGSRTYYSYQEFHEPIFDEVQIHPCFRRAVNTVERIRSR